MPEDEALHAAAARTELARYKRLFRATETAWALHEMVFDEAGDPVDYVFLDVNPAFERDTGLTADVCLGRRVTEIIPGIRDADPDLIALYGRVSLTGEPESFELYFKPFDRWYRVSASCPEHGFFIAAFEEITARKRAEEALFASEARFRRFFEFAPDYCYMVSPEGLILDVNDAALEGLGYAREELVGEPFRVLIPDEAVPRMRTLLRWWDRTGRLDDEEFTVRTRDGERRTVLVSAVPVKNADGEPLQVISVQHDITGRKRMEDMLERTTKELARSNRDLEQFAYVASHDLQEPLRMVASYLALLKEEYGGKLSEEADTYIGFSVDGAKRMQTLIRGLLAYARVDTRGRTLQSVPAERCVEAALESLHLAMEEADATVTHGELPPVTADVGQLTQLFLNLLGNALRFRGEDPPEVRVEAVREGDDWVFSVQDNGLGIASAHQDRVFEIFRRLHSREAYEGTGMGLALCKRIVERHGGRIWVESEEGEGATFRFTLPVLED